MKFYQTPVLYQSMFGSLTCRRSGLCPEHSQSEVHQQLAGAYFPCWDPSSGSAASRKTKSNPGIVFTTAWTYTGQARERKTTGKELIHRVLFEIFYYKLAKQKGRFCGQAVEINLVLVVAWSMV